MAPLVLPGYKNIDIREIDGKTAFMSYVTNYALDRLRELQDLIETNENLPDTVRQIVHASLPLNERQKIIMAALTLAPTLDEACKNIAEQFSDDMQLPVHLDVSVIETLNKLFITCTEKEKNTFIKFFGLKGLIFSKESGKFHRFPQWYENDTKLQKKVQNLAPIWNDLVEASLVAMCNNVNKKIDDPGLSRSQFIMLIGMLMSDPQDGLNLINTQIKYGNNATRYMDDYERVREFLKETAQTLDCDISKIDMALYAPGGRISKNSGVSLAPVSCFTDAADPVVDEQPRAARPVKPAAQTVNGYNGIDMKL